MKAFAVAADAPAPLRYNPSLDGLRAISIIAVVLFHCDVTGFNGGFIGLDVFFVLSGFLITSLLADEYRNGGIDAGRFYARRALRLYPSLLLMLVVYLAVAPFAWPKDDAWMSAAFAAVYLMDYAMAFGGNVSLPVGHTWSLGVEEKFYLLWPLALPLLLRTRRPIVWLLVAFLVVTTWRYYAIANWKWQQAYFSFDTRMSGILLGAIAALSHLRMSRPTVAVACVALAILMAVPSLPKTNQAGAVTLGITLAELSAFVLVCYAADQSKAPFLAWTPVVYIGRLSYGIYLWHFPALILVSGMDPWVRLATTILFAVTMAAMCLHWIDEPIKRWRARSSLLSVRAAIA